MSGIILCSLALSILGLVIWFSISLSTKRFVRSARKTIVENYSMDTFVSNWDKTLRLAANVPFRG